MRKSLYAALVCVLLGSALAWGQVPNITVRAQWAPNPAAEAVTSYSLTVDGGQPTIVLPGACSATVCELALTLSFAPHTVSLTATNEWGTGPASVVTVNLSIPGTPLNLRIVR